MHHLQKNYVQIVVFKKVCMKWQPIAYLCKQIRLITSAPNLRHSAIYLDFLYYLFLISHFTGDDFQIVKTPAFAESVTEGDVRWERGQ